MLGIERRKKILEILQEHKKVYVAKLAQEFNITEETVRRDLEKLEHQQLLQRSYGGAVLPEKATNDVSFNQRSITHVEEKQTITSKAATLIEDGDTIFMDSSSTALMLRPHLEEKNNITIITNSVRLLYDAALSTNLHILSTGGSLKKKSFALIGPSALDTIQKFSVDLAIISCKALSLEHDSTMESTEEEAVIKKSMIERSKKTILLADHHKFNQTAFVHSCPFSKINYLVTDSPPSKEWTKKLKQQNIELLF